ncbi:MAG: cytochrome c [Bauldia sp.]
MPTSETSGIDRRARRLTAAAFVGALATSCLVTALGSLALAQGKRTGAQIYAEEICAECHGATGAGDAGPALANNAHLSDSANIIRQVLLGSNLMPTFGKLLPDEDIAAVLTYVRANWGNRYSPIEASQVADVRKAAGLPPGPAPK